MFFRKSADKNSAIPRPRILTVMMVSLCIALLPACTTFRTANSDEPLTEQVNVGETVEITTNDGEKLEFVVTAVDDKGVFFGETYYAYDDLRQLRVRKVSGSQTGTGLVVVSLLAGVGLMLLLVEGLEDSVEDTLGVD